MLVRFILTLLLSKFNPPNTILPPSPTMEAQPFIPLLVPSTNTKISGITPKVLNKLAMGEKITEMTIPRKAKTINNSIKAKPLFFFT